MATESMTLPQYRAEKRERNMSVGEKVSRLNGRNEHLDRHHWTDEQLMKIPAGLIRFAYEHSAALRQEFSSLSTFQAYRSAMKRGAARVAGVRR